MDWWTCKSKTKAIKQIPCNKIDLQHLNMIIWKEILKCKTKEMIFVLVKVTNKKTCVWCEHICKHKRTRNGGNKGGSNVEGVFFNVFK